MENESTISSLYGRTKNVDDVIDEIIELQRIIKEQCNERFHYGVFYSWQSDSNSRYNRDFIERALKNAVKTVNTKIFDGTLIALDKDTKNIPGSPDITPTIMQKIDRSVCFVADVTPITVAKTKQIPNPNVMFELGYALSSLSYERVIIICNTAYCNIKELPFDLGLKRIITYQCNDNTAVADRKACEKELAGDLTRALMAVVNL